MILTPGRQPGSLNGSSRRRVLRSTASTVTRETPRSNCFSAAPDSKSVNARDRDESPSARCSRPRGFRAGSAWAGAFPDTLSGGLSGDELRRSRQQTLERVASDARQTHEHTRVMLVVLFEVIDVRLFLNQEVAVGLGDPDDQAVGLGLLVRRHARDQPGAMDERRSAPGPSDFDAAHFAPDRAHRREGHNAEYTRASPPVALRKFSHLT